MAHFTVPRTYEMLLPHLRRDPVLRETFFRKLKIYFYAAAGLGQRFWDELRDLAVRGLRRGAGLHDRAGAPRKRRRSRSAPGPIGAKAGWLGLPVPGLELKLTPVGTKREARVKGPNVTPGYWGDEALTRAAFDEEGYYKTRRRDGVRRSRRIPARGSSSTGGWPRTSSSPPERGSASDRCARGSSRRGAGWCRTW